MLFSLNFEKMVGKLCQVFAAHEHVRDSKVFLFQKAGILDLLFTTIKIWYFSKVFVLKVPVNKLNMVDLMPIVYFEQSQLHSSDSNKKMYLPKNARQKRRHKIIENFIFSITVLICYFVYV